MKIVRNIAQTIELTITFFIKLIFRHSESSSQNPPTQNLNILLYIFNFALSHSQAITFLPTFHSCLPTGRFSFPFSTYSPSSCKIINASASFQKGNFSLTFSRSAFSKVMVWMSSSLVWWYTISPKGLMTILSPL